MSSSSLAIDQNRQKVEEMRPHRGTDLGTSTIEDHSSTEEKTHSFAMRVLKAIASFFEKILKAFLSEEKIEVRSLQKEYKKGKKLHKSQILTLPILPPSPDATFNINFPQEDGFSEVALLFNRDSSEKVSQEYIKFLERKKELKGEYFFTSNKSNHAKSDRNNAK